MHQPTILIIEDNPMTRKMYRVALECENFHILEADDGKTALQLATENPIALILQDLILPDMNGFELNKKLRAIPNLENTAIIGLPGFLNRIDDIKVEKDSGFNELLLKPVDLPLLVATIKEYLPTEVVKKIGKRKRILLADDNLTQLKLLKLQLTNVGFLVETAVDGLDALQQIEKNPPDAVVSDVLMPSLDGFELCLKIRNNPAVADIPIILLTSHYLEAADFELGKNVSANYFLTRLPQATQLIEKIVDCCNITTTIKKPVKIEELKVEHTHRLLSQLQRQTTFNSQLAKRCSLQSAQLLLLEGIAEALTTSSGIDNTLQHVLLSCLDAAGISKALLYLLEPNRELVLHQAIGYLPEEKNAIIQFFKDHKILENIPQQKEIFQIPNHLSKDLEQEFLSKSVITSGLLIPLTSDSICYGILFLGSITTNIRDAEPLICTHIRHSISPIFSIGWCIL